MILNGMPAMVPARNSSRHQTLVVRAFLLALAAALMASPESCFATSSKVKLEQNVDDTDRVYVYVYEDPVFDETAVIQCYRDRNSGVAPWQDERADMAQDWEKFGFTSHCFRIHGASWTQRTQTFSSSHFTPYLV